MTRQPSLEEVADHILEKDAKKRKMSLRKAGLMDRQRRSVVARTEIPISLLQRRREEQQEQREG